MKRRLKAIAMVVAAILLAGVSFFAIALYGNWSAERKAREFCYAIPIGSDISIAIAQAKNEKILWGLGRFYTFIFPATFFDKAVCEVEVDRSGRVVRKGSVMVYD